MPATSTSGSEWNARAWVLPMNPAPRMPTLSMGGSPGLAETFGTRVDGGAPIIAGLAWRCRGAACCALLKAPTPPSWRGRSKQRPYDSNPFPDNPRTVDTADSRTALPHKPPYETVRLRHRRVHVVE